MKYKRSVSVFCKKCLKWYDEDKCEFENIEEDVQGKDVLIFTCPEGHEHQRSHRMG